MNQDMQAVINIAKERIPGVSNKCHKLPFLSSMPTVDMKVRNLDRQWDVAVVDYNDDTGEPVTLDESMGSVAEILQGERAGYATVHSEDKHPLWLREFWVRPTSNLMGRHKPDQKDKTAAAQWDRKRSRLAAADERSRILKDSDRAVAREAESKGYRRLPRPWQAPSVLSYNVEGMTDGNRHLMEQELNEARDMALQNALDEGLISLAFLDFARGRRSRIDAQGSGEYMGDSLSGYNSFLQVHWTRRVLPFPSVQRNHMRTRPGAIRDGLDDWGKPAYRIVRVAYTPGDRALEYLIRLGGGQSHGTSDAGGGTNGLFTGGGKPHRGRGSADRERGKSIGHASRYEEWVSLDDHGQEPIPDGFPDSDQLLDRSVDYQGVLGTQDPLADQYEAEVPEEIRGVLMWGAPDLWDE